MLSKAAFVIIYGIGIVWFFSAAIYTFKAVIKDFIELKKSNQ